MTDDDIETIAANSYCNFHAKGLDYLCIKRTPLLTVKAYFYDRPDNAGPEVVCPHDHRYPFATTILAGQSGHQRYNTSPVYNAIRQDFQRFKWRTPLNGGSGFEWDSEASLWPKKPEVYDAGHSYWCEPDEIHTIRIHRPDTVLLLHQFADVIPVTAPTATFVPGDSREPPNLGGLYDRMSVDRARVLLRIVRDLMRPLHPKQSEDSHG